MPLSDADATPWPCPDCGSPANLLTPEQAADGDGFHYVVCGKSCGREPTWAESPSDAVKEWNQLAGIEVRRSRLRRK